MARTPRHEPARYDLTSTAHGSLGPQTHRPTRLPCYCRSPGVLRAAARAPRATFARQPANWSPGSSRGLAPGPWPAHSRPLAAYAPACSQAHGGGSGNQK
eukprot:4302258-Prymnesium_polylepis.1